MKIWLRRILALTFISLGFALTFLPFNDTRSGSVEQEVVYLQKEILLDTEEIIAQFPGEEIIEVSGPEFNPDDYPDLWNIFNYLDEEWVSDNCDLSEWNRFQESVLQENKEFRLLVFRESLIKCKIEAKGGNSNLATFSYMGRYNTKIKELTISDLKKFPTIVEAIENINFGKESFAEFTPITIIEWDKMVDRFLNPMEDSQTFKFSGIFYGPEFGWDYTEIKGTISNLLSKLKIIGIALLLLGITILIKLYFSKTKKGISPSKFTIFLDVITLLFAIPSAYMALNLLLSKILFIPPIIEDEFLLFMGVFFFFIGIPALARYTSKYVSGAK